MDIFDIMNEIEVAIGKGEIQGFYQFADLKGNCTLVNLYVENQTFNGGGSKDKIVFLLKDTKGTATYDIEIPNKTMKPTRICMLSDRINACINGILSNVDANKLKSLTFKERFNEAQKRCGSSLSYVLDTYSYISDKTGKEVTMHNLIELLNNNEVISPVPAKPEKKKTEAFAGQDVPF